MAAFSQLALNESRRSKIAHQPSAEPTTQSQSLAQAAAPYDDQEECRFLPYGY